MKFNFLLLPMLCISALSQAQIPDAGVEFSYKDWDLICNRTGQCQARGYSPGDGKDGVSVSFTREAGPYVLFEGSLDFAELSGKPPSLPVTLLIDDEVIGEVRSEGGPFGEYRFILDDYHIQGLITALAGNTHIQFVDAQNRSWKLSDAGATAILIKMDELQERIQTPGAAIMKGDENEDWVPRPRPRSQHFIDKKQLVDTRAGDEFLASVSAVREALSKALDHRHRCPDLKNSENIQPLKIERLNEHRLLVSTQCSNNSFTTKMGFWVTEDRPPYLSKLVTDVGTRFDRNRAEIGSWQKQNALGDCVKTSYWKWDGVSFLLDFRTNSMRCRGFKNGASNIPSYVGD
ncbi:DUF1176 domain-containing protein [Pseudomonas sp. NPDC098747]|uniref:DUF1176 domain-containing protein n=1 Tax=Pseudomonas sp. NPDC098747 TaxID=3364487 RepID=UPI00383AF3FD